MTVEGLLLFGTGLGIVWAVLWLLRSTDRMSPHHRLNRPERPTRPEVRRQDSERIARPQPDQPSRGGNLVVTAPSGVLAARPEPIRSEATWFVGALEITQQQACPSRRAGRRQSSPPSAAIRLPAVPSSR